MNDALSQIHNLSHRVNEVASITDALEAAIKDEAESRLDMFQTMTALLLTTAELGHEAARQILFLRVVVFLLCLLNLYLVLR